MTDSRSILLSVGTSALAPALSSLFTNPADVAKTRLNLDRELQPSTAAARYRGVLHCLRVIGRTEGLAGLQRGLPFVLVRESSKNAFRLGLYEPCVVVLDRVMRTDSERSSAAVPMRTRMSAGMLTGALAAFICNPLDLLKTRLQADATGASALDNMRGLLRDEGVLTLWRRGTVANIGRSALATGVALPVNARLKELWEKELAPCVPLLSRRPALRDTACALVSAAATTLVINPLDLIRTRLYAQRSAKLGGGGTHVYRGVLHCAWLVGSTEGVLAFWKGSSANFLRIGPHQTLTFVFIGLLKRMAESRST